MSKKPQKMNSIAGRINRMWVWDLFWTFFWLNILAAVVVLIYRLIGTGGVVTPNLIWAELGLMWIELRHWSIPIIALQCLLLIVQLASGTRSVRRKLRPLYEAVETADKLSARVLDEEKFSTLEAAISQISPTKADRLETGDSDLEGLEAALNNLLERMRENYRRQARFVSDASHELRTPIAVIQGYVNMLDRWGKSDEKVLEESITAIQSESVHMQRLVEQLLFLARGDIGQTQIETKAFDLTAMLQEVYDESLMIDEAHTYRLLHVEEPIEAVGDQGLLKQVARILIENAAKYSPPDSRISLKAGRTPAGNPYFQIQDEGTGMTAADVPHIFERFYRADDSRTKSTGGTGLGLAIAKWIVDRHGGHFDVLTYDGLGTRIIVNLP
ncbi:MAG: HAMP domain-containing histidine kinase [Oscillospiraceae bacterium]|nr:HAMP domain-containing histidine kinase [Oscillospiraceae bacterium]